MTETGGGWGVDTLFKTTLGVEHLQQISDMSQQWVLPLNGHGVKYILFKKYLYLTFGN